MGQKTISKITVIILEDDPAHRKRLENMVKKVDFFCYLGAFENPLAALPLIDTGKVELIFSDINMPEMDGISFLKFLDKPPLTVFIASSAQYAVDGFDLNVVDYILKRSLSQARFDKCLERIKKKYYLFDSLNNSVMVKDGQKTFFLNPNTIYYISAHRDYIQVKTISSENLYMCTMKEAVERFGAFDFMQVHRSYLININYIEAIGPLSVGTLKARLKHLNVEIPIGPSYRESLFKRLNVKNG